MQAVEIKGKHKSKKNLLSYPAGCQWWMLGAGGERGCIPLEAEGFRQENLPAPLLQHGVTSSKWDNDFGNDQQYCLLFGHSVVSDSLRPHRLQPATLLCPWDFPVKNTGVSCYFLLWGTFPTLWCWFQYQQRTQKIWLRLLPVAPEEELKFLDFV